jgi:hypothetical protein
MPPLDAPRVRQCPADRRMLGAPPSAPRDRIPSPWGPMVRSKLGMVAKTSPKVANGAPPIGIPGRPRGCAFWIGRRSGRIDPAGTVCETWGCAPGRDWVCSLGPPHGIRQVLDGPCMTGGQSPHISLARFGAHGSFGILARNLSLAPFPIRVTRCWPGLTQPRGGRARNSPRLPIGMPAAGFHKP